MSKKKDKEKDDQQPNVAAADQAETTKKSEEAVETVDELTQLKQEIESKEDELLRARAEMSNMHKRFAGERQTLQKYRSQDLATKILPSLDNLERALQSEVTDEAGESLKKGILMVQESLLHALQEEGVELIEAENADFDPNLHHAVQTVAASDEQPTDTVVQVLQKGYKLHDRVLRPSMVVVAQ
ncbi:MULTISPECIES: nucleotide exchange factor GrpE [unclassified Enterococcus]|uniref:nucleotide exchange factor GrpE n=1 Tax=unclassified Enterococcus TaxID=2608891 RepID=UPI001553BA32|nr:MULTISPECIES: nucleotide exchange factor GrpE [unclassified Enterococcus]MBS7576218.1 nucleotide exchange factor GrpE [Enterococcus sp. MMGLQ5-2]MBS7583451.1 nucleotide exchange factor GrpE [Enterococcus sp. MMGLQ5-1]NPD11311.1 nucleotide exchange factor GrpE [Enterococcus sp. MMGLQ5-1]NPD36054.1 nucleotide exchange factor GrpE [Enterococcus sp. MMGLQ5-2]